MTDKQKTQGNALRFNVVPPLDPWKGSEFPLP